MEQSNNPNGMREDKISFKEGAVTISYPAGLQYANIGYVEDFFGMLVRKMRREIRENDALPTFNDYVNINKK